MIQDILSANICSFTVNNAVAEVVPVALVAPNNRYEASAGTRYLQPNDHCVVETLAIRFPFAFISGINPWQASILGYDSAGAIWNIGGLGGPVNSFYVHSENVEIEKEIYIDMAYSPTGLKSIFISNWRAGNVCCLNAPAVLNGQVYNVSMQIKIRHTLPLIA